MELELEPLRLPSDNQRPFVIAGPCSADFAGNGDKPTAFVEVKFFGTASGGKLNMLTKAICEIINSELGISPSQIYVKYEPTEYWGWNGRNF